MTKKLLALKAVLLLRKFNRYDTKENQIEEALKYYSVEQIEEWITWLKEDVITSNDSDSDYEDYEEHEYYCPSCTNGDYSPSSPWNAPAMSISDFI